jgi:hypothetical protein
MMLSKLLITALLSVSFTAVHADSNVVAVFLIGRHGDCTSKVQGNTQLTTLGKNQVFNTGSYFRSRYLDSSSPNFIENVDTNYLYNQIYAAAPYVSPSLNPNRIETRTSLEIQQPHFYKAFTLLQILLQRLV